MLVALIYLMAPLPNMIFGRYTTNDPLADVSSSISDVGRFLTAMLVVSGFGLPIVLAHAGVQDDDDGDDMMMRKPTMFYDKLHLKWALFPIKKLVPLESPAHQSKHKRRNNLRHSATVNMVESIRVSMGEESQMDNPSSPSKTVNANHEQIRPNNRIHSRGHIPRMEQIQKHAKNNPKARIRGSPSIAGHQPIFIERKGIKRECNSCHTPLEYESVVFPDMPAAKWLDQQHCESADDHGQKQI
ncbi:Vacuolar protein sorting-associated protein 55 [Mycoemilia scoparia]|uniref:Vacuolar protein sorting-associated protein 55 n=1 Tax=Mycoemilia scoparia TaxID=417184 RepID=A0A9W7ZY81_9FUNG|nr:Vacuolar protein sorting-associated protein 55 [Mycoemilia scoparia]